jgi:hypothetical protein
MPRRVWRFPCCTPALEVAGSARCPRCNRPGTFIRWKPAAQEESRRYEQAFALRAEGPHRAVADRTLAPHRQRCARCVGTGLIGERSGFRECPSCEGGGGIWAAPEAVLAEAYRSVVASFPDMAVAGALSPAIPFPVGGVAGAPRVVTAPVDPARRRLPREEFRSAFLQAEAELGTEWELKGRGHVPRATIRGPYSHVTEVTSCWQCFNPSRSHGHRFVFPLAVIERAAAILGVPAERIISRKY